ncbi:MAG: hypothetical protein J6R92_06595 [Akkermansia sp.]|nr:hypothetical protein [Akkermansia sp.]
MPLQLIHTSAPHLLDSSSAGYGTVARSEKLPRALCARLTALSILRDPKGGFATTGPQFSYTLINQAGNTWHVLTCTQNAGTDYSGRMCHIAHHLILNQDEVRTLHDSALRPTPAGLMLALRNTGFWKSRWEGEPRYLTTAPALTKDDLPDAEAQPTWKTYTGHKANARALYTPPYERDCLITIARGTDSVDILKLFHESDWLTHSRGWGISFTTEADEADSFTETRRMVTCADSPLVKRAQRTGHPVLVIGTNMEPPQEGAVNKPPKSYPLHPGSGAKDNGDLMRTLSRSVSHYHYIEEPDWLMFDVRPARSHTLYASASVAALLLLSIGCWWLYPATDNNAEDDITIESAESGIISSDHVQQLSRLLGRSYSHEHVAKELNSLSNITENTQEDTLLLEVVALLHNARQQGNRHAQVIKRLCECARLLGVKDKELVLLYLLEATHGVSPEDWHKQFDGRQLTDWIILKQSEPQILAILEVEDLRPFAPREKEPEPTLLATAEDTTPDAPLADEQDLPPGRISLIPCTAVSGMPLPDELESVIASLPQSVTTGTYVVSAFSKGGELEPAQRLDLSPTGYRLYITATDKDGEIALKLEHADGKDCPLPDSALTVRNGTLKCIRSGEREAVVSFPVPTKKGFHTNVILASTFGVPIPKIDPLDLPPVANVNLGLTPDSIELQTTAKAPILKLRKDKEFPWVLTNQETKQRQFYINLPVLTGHNSMQQTGDELSTYQWTKAEVTRETESQTTLRCVVTRRPYLPERLEEAFDRVANSPCCGEFRKVKNNSLTLARLYYICCALANEKLSRKEKEHLLQDYFSLFANKAFNKILCRILEQDTYLHITPEEAAASTQKSRKMRNTIKKYLDERRTRDLIRKRICEVLTRTLYAAYTQEQQILANPSTSSPVMILKNISVGSHVELLWQFQMQMKGQ